MVEKSEEKVGFEPSVAVTTVIESLPKSGNSNETRPSRKKRNKSKKQAIKKEPKREAPQPHIEGPKSSVWLSAISNLILLIAIFTIVVAAHRAIQKNKIESTAVTTETENVVEAPTSTETATKTSEATTETPPVAEVATEPEKTVETTTEPTPETTTESEKTAEAPAGSATVETPPTETATTETEKPEPETTVTEATETQKVATRPAVKKKYEDPYTNSGPLDLDRRNNGAVNQNVVEAFKEETSSHPNSGTDYKNPWNAGGHLDLDNQNTREEYRKNNYISITEPASDNNQ